jgi:hypothetical protein
VAAIFIVAANGALTIAAAIKRAKANSTQQGGWKRFGHPLSLIDGFEKANLAKFVLNH